MRLYGIGGTGVAYSGRAMSYIIFEGVTSAADGFCSKNVQKKRSQRRRNRWHLGLHFPSRSTSMWRLALSDCPRLGASFVLRLTFISEY